MELVLCMVASEPCVLLLLRSRGLLLLSIGLWCPLLGFADAAVLRSVELDEFSWSCNCWAARDVDAASTDPAAGEVE